MGIASILLSVAVTAVSLALAWFTRLRKDRRRTGRIEVEIEVRHAGVLLGLTKNIGLGGMFVATQRFHIVGDHLLVSFRLPGMSPSLSLDSEVKWTRETLAREQGDRALGMGLSFERPPARAVAAIYGFIDRREDDSR